MLHVGSMEKLQVVCSPWCGSGTRTLVPGFGSKRFTHCAIFLVPISFFVQLYLTDKICI